MNKIKLIFFHHAGGSSNDYLCFQKFLSNDIEFYAIDLSGRGSRIYEEFYKSSDEMLEDVYNRVVEIIKDSDYILFGHSMGAIIAYCIEVMLEKNTNKCAKKVFLSGKEIPCNEVFQKYKNINKLNDNEFFDAMIAYGGISKEFSECKELVDLFLPILKNDFKLLEQLEKNIKHTKLLCSISVFFGREDNLSEELISAWKNYTEKEFDIQSFQGGHFYIKNNLKKLCRIINEYVSLTRIG